MNESLKGLRSAAGNPGLRCETGWKTRLQSGDECVSRSLVLCGRGQVVDRENGKAMLASYHSERDRGQRGDCVQSPADDESLSECEECQDERKTGNKTISSDLDRSKRGRGRRATSSNESRLEKGCGVRLLEVGTLTPSASKMKMPTARFELLSQRLSSRLSNEAGKRTGVSAEKGAGYPFNDVFISPGAPGLGSALPSPSQLAVPGDERFFSSGLLGDSYVLPSERRRGRHDEDSVAPLKASARFAWRFPGLQRGRTAIPTLSREEIIADKLASALPAAPARPLHGLAKRAATDARAVSVCH
ncbi:hypothetical protein C8Q74DRAFT_1221848 [Fomes fomentarius]|nr:hypothetical protein C8Q74DRAFT_1221848 [Fomes fomentarius]